jgi:hypothetical protein
VISVCTRHEASIMIDQPPGAAQSLYPDLPSAAPAQKSDAPITPAAQALYGNSKVARTDTQGGSPLGGQAQPGTLLGAPPRAAAEPSPKATEAEPFDPAKVQAPEGVTYEAGLMNEYTAAVKELGLDHKGAARLLDLHTKTQQAETAAWDRTSAQWQREVQAHIPQDDIAAARNLILDDGLTDPALREWLAASPAGNWLPLVRTLANYAAAIERARRRY